MTQEELIREVGKVIPNGTYSEEVIRLAFIMFSHGYDYCVDKAVKWLETMDVNDYLKIVPGFGYVIEDEDAIKAFRKAMEE